MKNDRWGVEILNKLERKNNEYVFNNSVTDTKFAVSIFIHITNQVNMRRCASGLPAWIDKIQSEKKGIEILASQHGIARAAFKTWSKSFGNWKIFNSDAVEQCLAHKIDKKYNCVITFDSEFSSCEQH